MYVCICNAIREKELRKLACQIPGNAEDVYTAIGTPPQCGQCLDQAEAILNDARAAKNIPACIPH